MGLDQGDPLNNFGIDIEEDTFESYSEVDKLLIENPRLQDVILGTVELEASERHSHTLKVRV